MLYKTFNGGVEICQSDILDLEKLTIGMKDCHAIIHLVGIIREFFWKGVTLKKFHIKATNAITHAAMQNGIKRFVLMSALGVEKDINTKYMNAKREMEDMIKRNNFDYTIFRPSVIFGKRDQFINMFLRMIKNPVQPFVPVVASGNYLLQPISAMNIGQAFCRSLNEAKSSKQIYDLAGKEKYIVNRLLDLLGRSVGAEKVAKLHLRAWFVKGFAFLFNQLPLFPISNDQVKMLLPGNVTDKWQKAFDDFKMEPIGLEDYLSSMNKMT